MSFVRKLHASGSPRGNFNMESSTTGGNQLKKWSFLLLIFGTLGAHFLGFLTSSGDFKQAETQQNPTLPKSVELSAEISHDTDELLVAPSLLRTDAEKLVVISYATKDNYAFKRLFCSLKAVGQSVQALAIGEPFLGIGEKVMRLRNELEGHKNDEKTIVLFTDAYDVLFFDGADAILEKFKQLNSRIVFSADNNCWPPGPHCEMFPTYEDERKAFLNSGLFIGYAPDLYRLAHHSSMTSTNDDQEYYAKIYVDENLRRHFNISIDYQSQLFQTIEGALNPVRLHYEGSQTVITNQLHKTHPGVIHTPGYCKKLIFVLANFIPNMWEDSGYCSPAYLEDEDFKNNIPPNPTQTYLGGLLNNTNGVVLIISDDGPQEALDDLLNAVYSMDFPKNIINVYIEARSNSSNFAALKDFGMKKHDEYKSFVLNEKTGEENNYIVKHNFDEFFECFNGLCSYRVEISGRTHIDDPGWLTRVIGNDRSTIAPMFFGRNGKHGNFFMSRSRNNQCQNYFDVHGDDQFRVIVGHF